VQVINTDQELLTALQEEQEKHPELGEVIDLHREVISARAETEVEPLQLEPDEQEVAELIDRRVPLLRHWEPRWDLDRFRDLYAQICDIGARHREDLAGQFEQIRSALTEDADRTRELVADYLREGKVEEAKPPELDDELLRFVLNNGLHPFLQAYAAVLVPLIKDVKWYQKVCPICGGEPDFGYLEKEVGGLRLLCSRCDTLWTYRRGECSFCGNSEKETFAYYLGEDEVYRLYVCDKCKRYLKVLDGRETARKSSLPVQRIITIGMDISARQEGYR
jgi:FdhE protein